MTEQQKYIKELAKQKNVIILAHYYVNEKVQEISDYLGDSLYLAQQAKKTNADIILFCGVNFMAETAKILNPTKQVIVPDNTASCTLAEGVNVAKCLEWKKSFPNPYLISYINCATLIKTISDIICTSSNVLKVVKNAPKDATLLFAPDINLGNWVNKELGLQMQLWNGNCVVHHNYSHDKLLEVINLHPNAKILAHPECSEKILRYANFIGSTSEIINYAKQMYCNEFIILTEVGIKYKLKLDSPDKEFYFISANNKVGDNFCNNMKKHNLDKIMKALETLTPQIQIDNKIRNEALPPLEKMLEIS